MELHLCSPYAFLACTGTQKPLPKLFSKRTMLKIAQLHVFVPATSYTSVFIISKKRHHVEEEVEEEKEDKGKKGQWKTKGRKL